MDYLAPNYSDIFRTRATRLDRLRKDPSLLLSIKAHYRANPIQFVSDWGMTTDPRNIERGLPALIPFVPFGRQIEWMQWLLERWAGGENGLTEKTRDMGCSVAAMSLFSTLALFNRDFVAGVGSRKEALVDGVGDPNTLFHKAHTFLKYLPVEFRGGWSDSDKAARSHMKIFIPHTGSVIIGEAGDNIGRGGRASIYLLDESAHNRNQEAVDMSLSQTTRCRIDLSSVNGSNNAFAEKRFSGRVPVFTFHWRDDPRKTPEWYEREKARLPAVIVAQEIDIDYNASQENIIIPSAWVQCAIDAHLKLGPAADATRLGALDVADEGQDKNAFAFRHGILLETMDEWAGLGSDIFATSERAAALCDSAGVSMLRYDADGLGAGVRGDMRIINARPNRQGKAEIDAIEHRGSAAVVDPDAYVIEPDFRNGHNGRRNGDFFANYKAQSWWALRTRFEKTWKVIERGESFPAHECISISSRVAKLAQLQQELSQPTYSIDESGKIKVNKKPGSKSSGKGTKTSGSKSPNLADAVVIAFAPASAKKQVAMLM